jgi:hypothetical protein
LAVAVDDTASVLLDPTSEQSFYVLGCVEINGQDAEGLQGCLLAINAIEAQLPYEQYSEAASCLRGATISISACTSRIYGPI